MQLCSWERILFAGLARFYCPARSLRWCLAFVLQDVVRRMLTRDPRKRITAKEVLNHEWVRENGVATDNAIEPEVIKRIKGFAAMNRVRAARMMSATATLLPLPRTVVFCPRHSPCADGPLRMPGEPTGSRMQLKKEALKVIASNLPADDIEVRLWW